MNEMEKNDHQQRGTLLLMIIEIEKGEGREKAQMVSVEKNELPS